MQVDLQGTKEKIEATDNNQHAESLGPGNEFFEKLKKSEVSTTAIDPLSSLVRGSCCHCGQSIQLQSPETPGQQNQQEKIAEFSDYGYMTGLLQEIDRLRLGSQDTGRTALHVAMAEPVLKKVSGFTKLNYSSHQVDWRSRHIAGCLHQLIAWEISLVSFGLVVW